MIPDNNDNLSSKERNPENKPSTELIDIIIKYIYSSILGLVILAELVWVYFIAKGTIYLGKIPVYGDPEVVSAAGWDRVLVIASLVVMPLGSILWVLMIIVNYIFKMYKINESSLAIGIVAMLMFFILFISRQAEWLLD